MDVTREQLALVVRRAAELTAADYDAREGLSEDDVLRIAAELGLPAHHVQRALAELSGHERGGGFLDWLVGDPIATAARAVPGAADTLLDRLEDHFTTEEYLRLLRRREGAALFGPAEDTLSRIARSVRGSSTHAICRACELTVSVRPIEQAQAFVRVDVDVSNRRGGALAAGAAAGLGMFVAGTVAVAAVLAPFAPPALVEPAIATAFGAGAVGGGWAGVRIARARLRTMVEGVRTEAEGLLDRLERGQPLRSPPAPWRRRLQRAAQESRRAR
ncbi:MAG: hypothetical protein ACRELV_15760 [Longimicrobiales bacterium]